MAHIPAQKSEFETSKAFAGRVNESLGELSQQYVLSVYAVLDDDSLSASSPFNGAFSYDADTQELVIRSNIFISEVPDFHDPEKVTAKGIGLLVAEHSVPAGRYVGTTAMNAHAIVERTHKTGQYIYDHAYTLSPSDWQKGRGLNLFSISHSDPIPLFRLSLPPQRARAFKKQLKIDVVINPKAPYIATHQSIEPPTFSDPTELVIKTDWIVANVTCAILTDEKGKVMATQLADSQLTNRPTPDAPERTGQRR